MLELFWLFGTHFFEFLILENSVYFLQLSNFFKLIQKNLDFFVQRTNKKSILFMHFHTKNLKIFAALSAASFFKYYFYLALRILKIAKNSNYRHKIELSLRFSGKNTYFKQLFTHFLFLFYVILHAKKHFLWRYKKILCKKFLGLFVHVQRWVVQKKHCLKSQNYSDLHTNSSWENFPIVKQHFSVEIINRHNYKVN